MANRKLPSVTRWFSRAMGSSSSMSVAPPALLAATGVAYRQLGELFFASRMLDKAVSKGGDEMRQIIGCGFAKIEDHTAAAYWFRDDVPKINASLRS